MNIRFLETVIWGCRNCVLSGDGGSPNMTPAAISNCIGAMEQELGFRLFDRDARDVNLTAEGEAFVEGARCRTPLSAIWWKVWSPQTGLKAR